MKKLITLLGSVLVFTGLKAQPDTMIKKETTPLVKQPVIQSSKNNPGETVKQNSNIIIKEKVTLPGKKGIIIRDTNKPPVKVDPTAKPSKF